MKDVVPKPIRFAPAVATSTLAAALAASLSCLSAPETPCQERCDGNLRHACALSYIGASRALGIEDCGPSRTCVVASRSYGEYAACALEGGRDSRCNAEGESTFCNGERIARCHGAFRVQEVDCAAKGLVCETIVVNGAGSASPSCVRSHEREPRCETDLTQRFTFCEGDNIALCAGGFVVQSAPCAWPNGATRCVEVPDRNCGQKGVPCVVATCEL